MLSLENKYTSFFPYFMVGRKFSDLDTQIASTPYETVYTEDRISLLYYKSNVANLKISTPLLIVYALINRHTMLDLQPDRSVLKKLLDSGIDVYMIDWGYPTRKDKLLNIDDHVNGYLNNVVDFILEREGISKLNLMGVCMGGTLSLIYSCFYPEKIKNLILTVTPTNFDTKEGLLHVWWGDKRFDVDRFVDTLGNVPGDLLNINFLLMNPPRLLFDKYVTFYKNINDKKFVENFVRMEKWIFDSPDVPGETFREFIKYCYQENLLIKNKMNIGGRKVDLKKLNMPVLNIYAKYDHLVPPSACDKITSVIGNKDVEDVCLKTGHIGIYVSSKTQNLFVPKIIDWLSNRE